MIFIVVKVNEKNSIKYHDRAVYIERGNKIWYTENFSAYGVTSILR